MIPISDKNYKKVMMNLSKPISDIFHIIFHTTSFSAYCLDQTSNQSEGSHVAESQGKYSEVTVATVLIDFLKMRTKQKLQGCVGLTAPTLFPRHRAPAACNSK